MRLDKERVLVDDIDQIDRHAVKLGYSLIACTKRRQLYQPQSIFSGPELNKAQHK